MLGRREFHRLFHVRVAVLLGKHPPHKMETYRDKNDVGHTPTHECNKSRLMLIIIIITMHLTHSHRKN